MRTTVIAVLLAVPFLLAGGCVSQQHADQQSRTIRTLKERITQLEARIDELNATIAELRTGADVESEQVAELRAEKARLQKELDALQLANEQLREENARLARMSTQLPEAVESALKDFADRYPDLASYDPETGVVEFASDLTFNLGSADLSPQAQQALGRLAQVFNADPAREYEIRIVGHTDTVPIRKPATKQKHPTNWHLSVHRAIAVRDALEEAGIAPVRFRVAGYGPYRPEVQNTRRGAEANRRVELLLAPMGPVNESDLTPAGGAGQTDADNGGEDTGDGETNGGEEAPAGPAAQWK
jgi:chemotaxis protein MotB